MAAPIHPVTPETRDNWIEWLENQLNTTNNAEYSVTGKNRVFLTEEDDIDIARYVLSSFLATLQWKHEEQ